MVHYSRALASSMLATRILLLIVNDTIKFAICACVYARYQQKTEDRWLRPCQFLQYLQSEIFLIQF
jgi:hypothetical protein